LCLCESVVVFHLLRCEVILCVIHVTYFVIYLNHMVQDGTFVRETLALQAGTVCSVNCSKA
jgi:hypothetical protein